MSVKKPEVQEEVKEQGIVPVEQTTQQQNILMYITDDMVNALKQRYDMFRKLQKEVLEENIDYGFPAGQKSPDQKPSLYKSGAEKLSQLFGLVPEFIELKSIEERNFVMYKFRCELRTQDGRVVGIGYGVATSDEKTHWKQNPLGNANTIIKIAKKRSHVDAVLNGLGASNVFTQDLEDYEPEQINSVQTQVIQPKPVQPQQTTQQATQTNKQPSDKQKKFFWELVKKAATKNGVSAAEELKKAELVIKKPPQEWTPRDFSNMITLYQFLANCEHRGLSAIVLTHALADFNGFIEKFASDIEKFVKQQMTIEEFEAKLISIEIPVPTQSDDEEIPF